MQPYIKLLPAGPLSSRLSSNMTWSSLISGFHRPFWSIEGAAEPKSAKEDFACFAPSHLIFEIFHPRFNFSVSHPRFSPQFLTPDSHPRLSPQILNPDSHPRFSPQFITPDSHPRFSPQILTPDSHPRFSPEFLTPVSHPRFSPQILSPGPTTGQSRCRVWACGLKCIVQTAPGLVCLLFFVRAGGGAGSPFV